MLKYLIIATIVGLVTWYAVGSAIDSATQNITTHNAMLSNY